MLRRLATDLILPSALGAAAIMGFAPFGWYGLTLLALTGLLGLWWRVGPGRAAWRGWLFGFANLSGGLYLAYLSKREFGAAPADLLLPVLLSAMLALSVAAVGAFAAFTRSLPRVIWALLLVPAAWLLAELVSARTGTGLPLLSMGYAFTNAPLTPLIPLVGVYGLSFALVATAGGLLLLVTGGLVDRLAIIVVGCIVPLLLWFLPPATYWTAPRGQPFDVTRVQASLAQAPPDRQVIKAGEVRIGVMRDMQAVFAYKIAGLLPQSGLLAEFATSATPADLNTPNQRLDFLRMRALEAGRPLLLAQDADITASVSAPISTIIEADGQMRAEPQPLPVGKPVATVQPRGGATPYVLYGDKLLWALAGAFTLLGLMVGGLRRK